MVQFTFFSCPQCQNLHDSEHLTWLIVNHVRDLINLSHEPPVQDFISAVHRNSAASGLFIQAIQSRCDNLTTVRLHLFMNNMTNEGWWKHKVHLKRTSIDQSASHNNCFLLYHMLMFRYSILSCLKKQFFLVIRVIQTFLIWAYFIALYVISSFSNFYLFFPVFLFPCPSSSRPPLTLSCLS